MFIMTDATLPIGEILATDVIVEPWASNPCPGSDKAPLGDSARNH
jgi:hypothetical protein